MLFLAPVQSEALQKSVSQAAAAYSHIVFFGTPACRSRAVYKSVTAAAAAYSCIFVGSGACRNITVSEAACSIPSSLARRTFHHNVFVWSALAENELKCQPCVKAAKQIRPRAELQK